MKPENKALLRARATRAIADLYHNATVNYPSLEDADVERFQSWFEFACECEIDYLGSGGAYGSDYAKTLAAPCNAGRYKSPAARAYYVAKGLRAMRAEREDCGAVTGWAILESACTRILPVRRRGGPANRAIGFERNNSRWERISEYGKLYTFGRRGRTLAPADLYSDRGRAKLDPDELGAPALVDLIQILESFNAYVGAWCQSIPEQWAESERERLAEEKAEARRQAAERAKETRERHYWEARGVLTT